MNQDKSGGHATKQLLTAKKKSLAREQGTPGESFLISLLLLSFTLMNSFVYFTLFWEKGVLATYFTFHMTTQTNTNM